MRSRIGGRYDFFGEEKGHFGKSAGDYTNKNVHVQEVFYTFYELFKNFDIGFPEVPPSSIEVPPLFCSGTALFCGGTRWNFG